MHRRLIPFTVAVLLGFTACGGDDPVTRPTDPTDPATTVETTAPDRLDLDARAYYDDYEVAADYDNATGALPNAAPPMVDANSEAESGRVAPDPGPIPPDWPQPTEDNVFVDSGDSPWVVTDDDRESTFALDVDTGSFSIGRTFLDMGLLPEPDSIRAEEWVNAFDYADPARPADGDELGVSVETVAAPHTDDGTQLVRIAVGTAELAPEERPRANITFVIDTSGSMHIRERLGLVQSSLALLVETLGPNDTISIVTYGDEARPVLAPTPVAEAERIVAAIDALGPGGSTNMEAGLLLGYEQAREAFDAEATNVVVLASDGVANVGVTDADVLTQQITQAGEEGIHLVTVGYGMGNYNDQLMEQLANQGDGFYSYVDTFEEAERLFVDDLTPTLTVVAHDSKVQVVWDEDVVDEYRLIGYENRQLDDSDFRDDTVDAGELGAGHQVTALYEVRLAGSTPHAEGLAGPDGPPLGEVRLRWATENDGAAVERSTPIAPEQAAPTTSIRLAATAATFAELLRDNEVIVERGVTLEDLAADADELAAEGVDGADELAAMIDQAVAIDG